MLTVLPFLLCSFQSPADAFDTPRIVLRHFFLEGQDGGRFTSMGDFDGDGNPDLIGEWGYKAGVTRQIVRIWFGDGSGGFGRLWTDAVTVALDDRTAISDGFVEVGNYGLADGKDDFIHAYNESILGTATAVVRVFQDLSPLPSLVRTLRVPGHLLDVELGDWDGNGAGDFALLMGGPNAQRSLHLWLDGSTEVQLPLPPGAWGQLEPGEFTGGGGLDLAVVSPRAVVFRSLQQGAKVQRVPAVIEHGLSGPDSAVGDVDGDGREDVALFTRAGYRLLRQSAPGHMELGPLTVGGPATELADIDMDGDLDGICCGGGGTPIELTYDPRAPAKFELSLNDGHGKFSPSFSLPSLASEHIAGAVDFDRDGDIDLAAGRTIYFNPGVIRPRLEFPRELPALRPDALGDIDADGDLDYELTLTGGLLNDGDGSARTATLAMPPPPTGVTFTGPGLPGDFDQDGTLDLMVEASGASTGLHLLRNRGGGAFDDAGLVLTPASSYATRTALDARSCRVLDLDRDGDQDLIVHADTSVPLPAQFVDVWVNVGAGSFVAGQSFLGESLFDVVDLDADGHLDLAVLENTSPDKLFWRPGNGAATFLARQVILANSTGSSIEVEQEPSSMLLGTPGRPILVAMRSGWSYSYERSGTSWIEHALPNLMRPDFPDYRSKVWFCTADVNLDGRDDLLTWPAFGSGTAFGFSKPTGLPVLIEKLLMEPQALADVDGDGDPDGVSSHGVVLNLTRSGEAFGSRVQFETGCPGTGGLSPTLGARGLLVVGNTVELRIRGGRGGAMAVLARSRARSERLDWPATGVTSYVDPDDAFFVTSTVPLSGPPGLAGAGSATVTLPVPPGFAGVREYFQVWIADREAPGGVAASQGLELTFGN